MKAVICRTGQPIDRVLTRTELEEILAGAPSGPIPTHPEAVFLQPFCHGLTVDVGCGAEKVLPSILGIDRLRPGELGITGCMNGVSSVADISADGSDLYFIPDGGVDSVVSRHAFEHFRDPVATLREWLRILHPNGLLSVIAPDDTHHDFLNMDSDHKFRCYPAVISKALESVNNYAGHGVKGSIVRDAAEVQCRWSFCTQIVRI